MSKQVESGASPAVSGGGRGVDWVAVKPRAVDFEDTMSPSKVANVWEKMFTEAKLRAPSEQLRAAFRLAVYLYCLKNGTSREGHYSGSFQLSDGTSVEAAVIPRAAGKFAIRQFLRGCMEESYHALKESGVAEEDPRLVARAAELGCSSGVAFAMADWMTGCSLFTPNEKAAQDKSFQWGLSRARRARGGKSLEQVEDHRIQQGLGVQGPAHDGTDEHEF